MAGVGASDLVRTPDRAGRAPRARDATLRTASVFAMDGAATISLVGPAELLARGTESVARLDAVWSSSAPTSMVARLNAAAAGSRRPTSMDVGPHTALLVHRARLAWQATGGLFDPTADLGDRVCARPTGMGGVFVDLARHRVTFPAGLTFDPAGIGRGLAADLVAVDLIRHGACDVVVDIGGDLRVMRSARPGYHPGWQVVLDVPGVRRRPRFQLVSGAAATSHADPRTTAGGGGESTIGRPVVDPRTGAAVVRDAPTDVVAVTVVAGQAWLADALATAALVAGTDHAAPLLTRAGTPALLLDRSGRLRCVGAMRRWLT